MSPRLRRGLIPYARCLADSPTSAYTQLEMAAKPAGFRFELAERRALLLLALLGVSCNPGSPSPSSVAPASPASIAPASPSPAEETLPLPTKWPFATEPLLSPEVPPPVDP